MGLHWKVRLLEDKRMVAVNSCGTQVQFLRKGQNLMIPVTNAGNQLINGGRCRIRTYDFHRVKVTLYR